MTPNVCRSSAELRPNSHMLPSRTEPNIRPNSSAELRRLPNFGPSLMNINDVLSLLGIFPKILGLWESTWGSGILPWNLGIFTVTTKEIF